MSDRILSVSNTSSVKGKSWDDVVGRVMFLSESIKYNLSSQDKKSVDNLVNAQEDMLEYTSGTPKELLEYKETGEVILQGQVDEIS
ncbi:hypothetical protein N9N97_01395 [Rickettsiaceae bacterium]|nr:hypothetical protein [Rickettsiaceae bacterium]